MRKRSWGAVRKPRRAKNYEQCSQTPIVRGCCGPHQTVLQSPATLIARALLLLAIPCSFNCRYSQCSRDRLPVTLSLQSAVANNMNSPSMAPLLWPIIWFLVFRSRLITTRRRHCQHNVICLFLWPPPAMCFELQMKSLPFLINRLAFFHWTPLTVWWTVIFQ